MGKRWLLVTDPQLVENVTGVPTTWNIQGLSGLRKLGITASGNEVMMSSRLVMFHRTGTRC